MGAQPESLTGDALFEWGEEGEHRIARLLMLRGCVVAPLYQYTKSSAPVAMWWSSGKPVTGVLPDLSCWKGGEFFFVEVKRKTRWTLWEGRRETGCDWRLFQQYLRIRQETGVPVWLFFVHEDDGHPKARPTGVYAAPLSRLAPGVRFWDGKNRKTGRRVTEAKALFPSHLLLRVQEPDIP